MGITRPARHRKPADQKTRCRLRKADGVAGNRQADGRKFCLGKMPQEIHGKKRCSDFGSREMPGKLDVQTRFVFPARNTHAASLVFRVSLWKICWIRRGPYPAGNKLGELLEAAPKRDKPNLFTFENWHTQISTAREPENRSSRVFAVHYLIRSYGLALGLVWLRLMYDLQDWLFFYVKNEAVRDATREWANWVVPLLVLELWLSWLPMLRSHLQRSPKTD